MAAPLKIVVVGPALGNISSLFEKVKALDSKYGKFEFAICVGDFFGPPSDENDAQIDDLLAGRTTAPLATYIMTGMHTLPEKIQRKVEETGGEICPNLMYLDQASVITTSHGLRIATLGGQFDAERYNSKDPEQSCLRKADIQKLLGHPTIMAAKSQHHKPGSLAAIRAAADSAPTKIDILLTHAIPDAIVNLSPNAPPASQFASSFCSHLNGVIEKAMPRYHFASGVGTFWEREPFAWPGVAEAGRVTRFISLGPFGGSVSAGEKKPRWSYAFSIVPLTPNSATLPTPANATLNPFLPNQVPDQSSPRLPKRPLVDDGPQFRWSTEGQRDTKRRKRDNGWEGRNRGGQNSACQICESAEHESKDCPDKQTPPEGYVCRRCNQGGHYIRDCPTKYEKGDTGGKKPPPGYVCRGCASELHLIDDCPAVQQNRQEREERRRRDGPPKDIGPDECWFCLSNPKLAKHLLVSLGEECYVTLTKGGLPDTTSSDPQMKELFPIPGGGHVLIVPISHHPTLLSLPPDEAATTLVEVEKYKAALRNFYAKYDVSPVFFEVAKRRAHGVHAHIQVIPIPNSFADGVEGAFRHQAEQLRVIFEPDSDADPTVRDIKENYFLVELPNGKKMLHLIKDFSPFPLQIGRVALATLLDLPDRVDWKNCTIGDRGEAEEATAFKKAFKEFDPCM